MTLDTDLSEVSRALKMYSGRLTKLDIRTVGDLLFHIPSRYEDFSLISPIGKLQEGERVTVRGTVHTVNNDYTKYAKKVQKAVIGDDTGTIEAIWFNQPYLLKVLKPHTDISLSGKVTFYNRKLVIQPTEYEVLFDSTDPIHTGRLVPIYPETYGVSSKWLRRQVYSLLRKHSDIIEDTLPENIRKEQSFDSLEQTLQNIHFPASLDDAQKARERLSFEELLLLHLKTLKRRSAWDEKKVGKPLSIQKHTREIQKFITSLPFTLTSAQEKAIEEIFSNLESDKPMNRLLQGDVGSGKTVVAAVAMFAVFKNNMESVLMAPTEILAQQHFKTLSKLLTPHNIKVGIATGSTKQHTKKGEFDVLVGTHALLHDSIGFTRLGLVVIDEQQRFGVEQRGTIRGKGKNPHLLTMTATPIPRTVALTLYGDLDLSVLKEMPKGRKKIKTWLVPPIKRTAGYDWIRKEIRTNNSQAFIICPFIEESENMQTVKAATTEFERLRKDVYPDLKLGLLHGKLKPKEKEAILLSFRNNEFDILVATPVVEVGIDIPNATVIVIEGAERFGLAQLHQLRGRVGRGDKQSYCLLFTESKNPATLSKLRAMEKTHIGSELAELDFKLRGPGEMYGTLQSGANTLKVASFSDTALIHRTRVTAEKLYKTLNTYPSLKKKLLDSTSKNISPD